MSKALRECRNTYWRYKAIDKNTEKLKKSLDWLFDQTYLTKRSFDAILAVSKVYSETSVLGLYGDYFGYTQNVMIGEVQLSLAKIFVENKDSHSIVQVDRKSVV